MTVVSLQPLPDGKRWRLLEPLVAKLPFGIEITVPKGYETDGASIPRVFRLIIGSPMTGRYRIPAIVHDYLCDQARLYGDGTWRFLADAIFVVLCKQHGVPAWKRLAIAAAIRVYALWRYGL